MAITIKNGAKVLYQWERGVALTVTSPCNLVRVSREDDKVGVELTPSWSGSTGTVIIPDRMLTESGYLHAARVDTTGDEERILETARFLVRSAQKPGNNAAATKEVKEWEELQLRMDAIERAAREGDFDGKDGDKGDKGDQGDPGITPHIGEDFHWYIGDIDTGVIARGIDGGQIEPFCYTYGIANNDDPTAFAATVTGAMEFSINPGVIYIKGVARKFAKMTITRLTHDFDQNYVVLCRYDEGSGEISYLFREVTLQGSLIISIEDAARLPMRQGGKYDLLLCLIKIPAGTTTITQDMLVDLRANEAYCGYVRSKIYALERPSIGANGNWFIGDEDTGVKAQGAQGPQGLQGEKGERGEKGDRGEQGQTGATGATGAEGPQGIPGADGLTPYIGTNGNWWIGETDTGVAASGGSGDVGALAQQIGQAQKKADDAYTLAENAQPRGDYALKTEIPTTLPASDVYAWAKAANKPTYGKSDVGLGNVDNVKQYSASNPPPYPVTSVNGKTGAVSLAAGDVGASATGHKHTTTEITDFPSEMTPSQHYQSAETITKGRFGGQVIANSSGQAVGTPLLRNSMIVSSDTDPDVNGEIYWTYK